MTSLGEPMPRLEAMPNTPEWVAARRGCLTASRMKHALDILKSGKSGADRQRYLMELVAERMTGNAVDHFVTDAMQHGIDNEAPAVRTYELQTGIKCNIAWFYLHDTIDFFGASPDRLIGTDGLVEVKCPSTTKYIGWLRDGEIPEEHLPQILAQLAVTQRKWCDFVAYDPRVVLGPKLFVKRYEPTAEQLGAVEQGARTFLDEVDSLFMAVTHGLKYIPPTRSTFQPAYDYEAPF
jgi:predicted phage-related endonuclease